MPGVTHDLGGGGGEVVKVEGEGSLVLTQTGLGMTPARFENTTLRSM